MKIETKYNIGDKVYFLFENKVQRSNIQLINIRIGNKIGVEYYIQTTHEDSLWFTEEEIFPTKEDLLKSL